MAVESGAIYTNPVDAKPPEGAGRLRIKIASKKIRLPGKDEFFQLFAEMESSGSGWAPYTADLARFLAFSGMRIGEARRVKWKHIDFKKEQLHVPGTKSETSLRVVPMLDAMKGVLKKMYEREGQPEQGERVLRVGECQKSIDRACEILGIERITHHDFREGTHGWHGNPRIENFHQHPEDGLVFESVGHDPWVEGPSPDNPLADNVLPAPERFVVPAEAEAVEAGGVRVRHDGRHWNGLSVEVRDEPMASGLINERIGYVSDGESGFPTLRERGVPGRLRTPRPAGGLHLVAAPDPGRPGHLPGNCSEGPFRLSLPFEEIDTVRVNPRLRSSALDPLGPIEPTTNDRNLRNIPQVCPI